MISICRILQCVILFLCRSACLGRKLLKCNSDTERGGLTKQKEAAGYQENPHLSFYALISVQFKNITLYRN